MTTKCAFLLAVFVFAIQAVALGDKSTNGSHRSTHMMVVSASGAIEATVEPVDLGKGHLVCVSDRDLAWIGAPLPGEKYICYSNSVVRIAPDCDALLVDRQTTRLHGASVDKQKVRSRIVGEFERRASEGRAFDAVQKLSLGELLLGDRGLSPFLPPAERVRPARAATIADVEFKQGRLLLTLVGENQTKVVLAFDADMNLVSGEINGKPVYPRTNMKSIAPEATN